jgi:carboxylesterase
LYWILGFCLIAAIWVLGDLTYASMVSRAARRWEATVERDAHGVQLDARPITLAGGDTAILLVHGFNDIPRTFERMAPALHQSGFTVRAVRLQGFGVPAEQMHDCTWEQWVQLVVGELAVLRKNHSRVVLTGHSLGGAVALAAVRETPELVDGLALMAPAIEVSNQRSPLLPTRFWRALGDRLLWFSTIYQSPYDRNDCSDPQYRNPSWKSPFSSRNIVQQTFGLMDHNRHVAAAIYLPVLMFLSRNDQVTDWQAAERYFNRLGSRQKQLRFYDTSGHAMTVDQDWQSITGDLVEFVRQLEGDRATGNR